MRIAVIDDKPDDNTKCILKLLFNRIGEDVEFVEAVTITEAEELTRQILDGQVGVDFIICDREMDKSNSKLTATKFARQLKERNFPVITWSYGINPMHQDAGHYFVNKLNFTDWCEFLITQEFLDKLSELKSLRENNEVKFN